MILIFLLKKLNDERNRFISSYDYDVVMLGVYAGILLPIGEEYKQCNFDYDLDSAKEIIHSVAGFLFHLRLFADFDQLRDNDDCFGQLWKYISSEDKEYFKLSDQVNITDVLCRILLRKHHNPACCKTTEYLTKALETKGTAAKIVKFVTALGLKDKIKLGKELNNLLLLHLFMDNGLSWNFSSTELDNLFVINDKKQCEQRFQTLLTTGNRLSKLDSKHLKHIVNNMAEDQLSQYGIKDGASFLQNPFDVMVAIATSSADHVYFQEWSTLLSRELLLVPTNVSFFDSIKANKTKEDVTNRLAAMSNNPHISLSAIRNFILHLPNDIPLTEDFAGKLLPIVAKKLTDFLSKKNRSNLLLEPQGSNTEKLHSYFFQKILLDDTSSLKKHREFAKKLLSKMSQQDLQHFNLQDNENIESLDWQITSTLVSGYPFAKTLLTSESASSIASYLLDCHFISQTAAIPENLYEYRGQYFFCNKENKLFFVTKKGEMQETLIPYNEVEQFKTKIPDINEPRKLMWPGGIDILLKKQENSQQAFMPQNKLAIEIDLAEKIVLGVVMPKGNFDTITLKNLLLMLPINNPFIEKNLNYYFWINSHFQSPDIQKLINSLALLNDCYRSSWHNECQTDNSWNFFLKQVLGGVFPEFPSLPQRKLVRTVEFLISYNHGSDSGFSFMKTAHQRIFASLDKEINARESCWLLPGFFSQPRKQQLLNLKQELINDIVSHVKSKANGEDGFDEPALWEKMVGTISTYSNEPTFDVSIIFITDLMCRIFKIFLLLTVILAPLIIIFFNNDGPLFKQIIEVFSQPLKGPTVAAVLQDNIEHTVNHRSNSR